MLMLKEKIAREGLMRYVQICFHANVLTLCAWCAGDSRSSEMRYESAWRMGQWDSPFAQAEITPGQPVGTNQAIQGCLKVHRILSELVSTEELLHLLSYTLECDGVLDVACHLVQIMLLLFCVLEVQWADSLPMERGA